MVLVSFHIDHQGSEINKNNIFYILAYVLYKNFLPTTHSINLHLGIIALVLDFYRHTGHVRLKFLRMNKNS